MANLTRYQHARAILALGLPLIGGIIAQYAVQITDTVMLGWYDVRALAAVVLGSSFFFVLFIMGSGYASAVMPVIATAAASGNEQQVRRATRMAMWHSLLFGFVVMPIFLFSGPILTALGQEEDIARMGEEYLAIAGWGLIPALLAMVLRSYLSALEHAKAVLWITSGAAVLNGLADYALIFGKWGAPELGVAGAAIASVLLQIVTLAGMVGYAILATPEHTLFQRLWRPDWEAFRNIFALGWPISLTMLAEVGLFSASAIMVGWIGTVELAAHGIAIQLASIAFLVHLGLSQAATIRAGQAFGRKDRQELASVALVSTGLSFLFAFCVIGLFLFVPQHLLSLFISPDDALRPQLIAAGTGLLAVAALFQLADAGQVMSLSLLRGLHDTKMPMVYAAVSYWAIGVPASYFLGFTFGLGAQGVWFGLVFGLTLAWITMGARFIRKVRQPIP